MKVWRPERVEVRVGDTGVALELLYAGLRGRGTPQVEHLEVAPLTDDQGGMDRRRHGRGQGRCAGADQMALWHGNAPDAIDDIECLADYIAGALEQNPTSASLRKLAITLGEFATYITNNLGHIVNYGERFRAGERISTELVKSAVNQIVDKRLDKRQSMRWTPRGAHLYFRPEHASSTAVSINSSVAATQRSGKRQATTLPPVCDGLPVAAIWSGRPRVRRR